MSRLTVAIRLIPILCDGKGSNLGYDYEQERAGVEGFQMLVHLQRPLSSSPVARQHGMIPIRSLLLLLLCSQLGLDTGGRDLW